MFAKEIYIRRRSALCGKMGSGLILIPGNMLTPNNYLNNAYYSVSYTHLRAHET